MFLALCSVRDNLLGKQEAVLACHMCGRAGTLTEDVGHLGWDPGPTAVIWRTWVCPLLFLAFCFRGSRRKGWPLQIARAFPVLSSWACSKHCPPHVLPPHIDAATRTLVTVYGQEWLSLFLCAPWPGLPGQCVGCVLSLAAPKFSINCSVLFHTAHSHKCPIACFPSPRKAKKCRLWSTQT